MVLVFPPLSNESIREAVWLWRHDQAQATEKYNHINKWNTSQVTNINMLFLSGKDFITQSSCEYVRCVKNN